MKPRHTTALALIGWYLKNRRSGNCCRSDRPAREGGHCRGHAIITIPGKANTLTHAPLGQSDWCLRKPSNAGCKRPVTMRSPPTTAPSSPRSSKAV